MNHIKVVVNEGGVVDNVLISSEIADSVLVEVIDLCTDDPEELDLAEGRMKFAQEQIKNGKLKSVY